MSTTAEVTEFLDRAKIRDALVRLARGEDRRDAKMIAGSYWRDSVTDYGVFKGSFDDYLAWVVPGSPAILDTQHILGQSYVELKGDIALVETHVISYHRVNFGTEERDTCIGGRYLDKMQKRGGDWRIAERRMLYDWSQDWGVATDWSKGVMGMAFSDPRFSGRAHGDWSEAFFGKK
jgi:hypothetical protein